MSTRRSPRLLLFLLRRFLFVWLATCIPLGSKYFGTFLYRMAQRKVRKYLETGCLSYEEIYIGAQLTLNGFGPLIYELLVCHVEEAATLMDFQQNDFAAAQNSKFQLSVLLP